MTTAAGTALGAAATLGLPAAASADVPSTTTPLVALAALNGSTEPTTFRLDVPAGAYKLVVDGNFLGSGLTADPATISVAAPGAHKLRIETASGRVDASWTTSVVGTTPTPPSPPASTAPAPSSPATPPSTGTPSAPPAPGSPAPGTSAPSTGVPTTPVGTGVARPADGHWTVSTEAEIRAALTTAHPGDVITLTDGEHLARSRYEATASGTATAPITLQGTRAAMLRTKNASGDYGLHITGSYWHITGITVAHGSKGIVLDGSHGTVLDGVEVFDVGDEGVHFRSCTTDSVLENSYVHDTGINNPQYGEGVYVGSANSNWAKYNCTDGRDNSERNLVQGNVFRNIPAEGADLKEGTDSGTLRNNLFDGTGFSGKNSADSAVDVKGNNWLIEGNTVRNPQGADLDGFQVHSVYTGYGNGNTFKGNVVQGLWAGWGIALYPLGTGNVIGCDDAAPGAKLGLAGANTHSLTCKP
ncbi:parallel beta helix pectate lyase-like protein [Motilibacter rhizosphaerae]|uniref:Parallel beta helix pectate lyase-like protein n=1 Tax=Motilibacter rhizosphaerae TaxID=598652 RepID=A0A4Q7NSD8_9ACTN|nr:right-handed parallel beta-helix repeat-containing protein [Motilibacter rhizosphaerae]RZS90011.1 parallel beta helix pectate lyase-like protein [Motilibacter rhizosphaerae]